MTPRRPGPGALLAGASGVLLLLVMFLPWFGLNGRARVPGTGQVISLGRDNLSAWEAFGAIDVVLAVAAALAILVLVVALVSTPPPALVAAAAGAAAVAALLIVYRLIDVPDIAVADPGDTAYETGRRLGVFFGLLCTAGIAWGAGRVAAEAAVPEGVPAAAPARPEPEPATPARRARPLPLLDRPPLPPSPLRPPARSPAGRAPPSTPSARLPGVATTGAWAPATRATSSSTPTWSASSARRPATSSRRCRPAGRRRRMRFPTGPGSATTCPRSRARCSVWGCWASRPAVIPRSAGSGRPSRRCRPPPRTSRRSSSRTWSTRRCSASARARPASTCWWTTRRC